jgi:hypothetical protein
MFPPDSTDVDMGGKTAFNVAVTPTVSLGLRNDMVESEGKSTVPPTGDLTSSNSRRNAGGSIKARAPWQKPAGIFLAAWCLAEMVLLVVLPRTSFHGDEGWWISTALHYNHLIRTHDLNNSDWDAAYLGDWGNLNLHAAKIVAEGLGGS